MLDLLVLRLNREVFVAIAGDRRCLTCLSCMGQCGLMLSSVGWFRAVGSAAVMVTSCRRCAGD